MSTQAQPVLGASNSHSYSDGHARRASRAPAGLLRACALMRGAPRPASCLRHTRVPCGPHNAILGSEMDCFGSNLHNYRMAERMRALWFLAVPYDPGLFRVPHTSLC